jgi:hypothetical protein
VIEVASALHRRRGRMASKRKARTVLRLRRVPKPTPEQPQESVAPLTEDERAIIRLLARLALEEWLDGPGK